MQCLSSNNDLWQQKYVESGDGIGARGNCQLERTVCFILGEQEEVERGNVNAWQDYQEAAPVFFTIRCDPHPFRFPSFIGGDYDHRPVLGIPPPNGRPGL
ncbi:hypothetical protein OIU84_007757 [Salix udensis]|uniref:Uncharacterized protein n=1 Tax=Salix udensis TaxID=889485 RepID=A0AAD6JTK3_9ROSI|nr:hypothetical protein OIU84_007757 [Salix udensis]